MKVAIKDILEGNRILCHWPETLSLLVAIILK